jgi:hypothetical protein
MGRRLTLGDLEALTKKHARVFQTLHRAGWHRAIVDINTRTSAPYVHLTFWHPSVVMRFLYRTGIIKLPYAPKFISMMPVVLSVKAPPKRRFHHG